MFDRAVRPAFTRQLTHTPLRHSELRGREARGQVDDVVVWRLRDELELDRAGLLERADLVDEEPDDLAVRSCCATVTQSDSSVDQI